MDIERPIVLTGPTIMNRQTAARVLARGGKRFLLGNAALLFLVSAVAFVGCKQGRGDRCQQDSDCGSGLVCGASCSLTTSTCTCEPIVGAGTGGTTVVSTGGTTGSGGSNGTGGMTDQGGAGGGAGGIAGDSGGAAGEAAGGAGGGGGMSAGGDSGAGGAAGTGDAGGSAGAAAGGAGGA